MIADRIEIVDSRIVDTTRNSELSEHNLGSRVLQYALDVTIAGNPHRTDDEIYILRNNIAKLVEVMSSGGSHEFSPDENQVMHDVIDSALGKYDKWFDESTGMLTRKGFFESAEKLLSDDSEYFVLFADLDNFKTHNDKYDHAVGDLFLKAFGAVLGNNVRHRTDRRINSNDPGELQQQRPAGYTDRSEHARRNNDDAIDLTVTTGRKEEEHAGRYGGDEFVVVVQTDQAGTEAVMRRLSNFFAVYDEDEKKVYIYTLDKEDEIQHRHRNLARVTMTIGSAQIQENGRQRLERAVSEADKNMIRKKSLKKMDETDNG